MPKQPRSTAAVAERLAEVARALGRPVEAFYSELEPGGPDEAAALLRLWSAITDVQGRQRVMAMARQEAERSGYEEGQRD